MKIVNIISIDQQVYESIKMNGASVQGIYQSTIHLSLNETIITIGYRVGRGKHHILIEEPVDFKDQNIILNAKVEVLDQALNIGSLCLKVSEQSVNSFYPYLKTYHMNSDLESAIENLKQMITENHEYTLFNYDQKDLLLRYQFEKINQFLKQPTYLNALSILGLGIGLTPLGDDVLTGYILGLNTIGQSPFWMPDLIEASKTKTNTLSAQNITDTYDRNYPDVFVEMIEALCNEYTIEKAKPILDLGATSGAGILTGFIYGLMLGEDNDRLQNTEK